MVVLDGVSLDKFMECIYSNSIPVLKDGKLNTITDQESSNTFPIGTICIYCKDIPQNPYFVKVKVVSHIPSNEWFEHPRVLVKEVNDENEYDPQSCTFFSYNQDNLNDCHPGQLLPWEFLNSVST